MNRYRMMLIFLACSMLASIPAAGRFDAALFVISPESSAHEIVLFDRVGQHLLSSEVSALRNLGELAQEAMSSYEKNESESMAAKIAIFHYRLQRLPEHLRTELAMIVDQLQVRDSSPSLVELPFAKHLMMEGCESEVLCDNGDTKTCSCISIPHDSSTYGSCYYSSMANPWGGSVTCNCIGIVQTHSCQPTNTCDPAQCNQFCGGPGICTATGCQCL